MNSTQHNINTYSENVLETVRRPMKSRSGNFRTLTHTHVKDHGYWRQPADGKRWTSIWFNSEPGADNHPTGCDFWWKHACCLTPASPAGHMNFGLNYHNEELLRALLYPNQPSHLLGLLDSFCDRRDWIPRTSRIIRHRLEKKRDDY